MSLVLNRMRRADAARDLNGAGTYRRLAATMRLRPEERREFVAQARRLVRWSGEDRRFAQAVGFKLP